MYNIHWDQFYRMDIFDFDNIFKKVSVNLSNLPGSFPFQVFFILIFGFEKMFRESEGLDLVWTKQFKIEPKYEEPGPNSLFPLMRLIQTWSSLNSHPPLTVILSPMTYGISEELWFDTEHSGTWYFVLLHKLYTFCAQKGLHASKSSFLPWKKSYRSTTPLCFFKGSVHLVV